MAEATSFEEWVAARVKEGRAFEERQQKNAEFIFTFGEIQSGKLVISAK